MASKDLILDFADVDLNHVLFDLEHIRKYNPQRFEMEQLSAIVLENIEEKICAGYKDITANEFWVRGHMPQMPLMPGVLICESAAQLCSFFAHKYDLMGEGVTLVGFGGMEDVRFRDTVRVGDRLLIVCKLIRVRLGTIVVCKFQAFVGQTMVADGKIKGIPLPVDLLGDPSKAAS